MSYRIWFIYISLFIVATFIDSVGGSSISVGDPSDINLANTYQVDQISSGSGFFGLVRTSVSVLTDLVPKFVTWNFGFLTGDFAIVRYTMVFIFGGLLTITLGQQALGLLRRNV